MLRTPDDAKEIFFTIQTRQAASPFPVSERLVLRLSQLSEVLGKASPGPAEGDAPPEAKPVSPTASLGSSAADHRPPLTAE